MTSYERGDVVTEGPDYGVSGTPSVTESFTYDSLVSGDVVLTQTQADYDGDGNVIETITGALGTPTIGIGARVYYEGFYYDDANRLVADMNVGTNGGSSWTMPTSPPSRSDSVLETTYGYAADAVQTVMLTGSPTGGTFTLTFGGDTTSSIAYNASASTVQSALVALGSIGSGNVVVTTGINGGWQVRFTESLGGTYENQITASGSGLTGGTSPGVSVSTLSLGGDNGNVVDTADPDDIDSRDYYDPLGNVVQEVQDFTTGAINASTNKTTDYTYNSAGMTSLTAAMLNSGGTITGETTEWIYGVTTGSGSDIDSNDIVSATYQPNPSTGAPDSSLATTVTVDALGETITNTDPNGTEHEYGYDVLGQQTSDYVATFASGVDTTVDKITTSYTTLGNVYLVTSYNSSSEIVNQVEMLYNGLDQEIQEFEAVNGAVNVESTPSVQDNYTDIADGNNSRLTSIVYPDGYTVDYNYSSGLDSDISRLSYLSDDTGTLQSYQYLGLNTVVVMAEPQADIELTYLSVDDSTGAAGDEYTGLDQFGRVDEQLWYNTSTSTAVYDVQYIRDDDGNVRFSIDTLHSSMGGLYEYDSLGQVTEYEQGDVVYLGPDYGISGSVVESETFTYDSLGNDLVNSTTTTGTTTITSTFNYDNQIASISSGTLPTYDSNGNMTTDQNDLVYVVNAWNEIVTIKNSGGTTLETYSYDGLGDRMTNTVYTDDVGTTTNFYSSSGQVLEEQANATGYYTQRYVWSPTYINSMVDRDTDTSGSGLTPTGSEFSRIWPIQDANYNTVALVVMSDDTATVVERYAYLPFGSVTYMNGSYSVISGSGYNWLNLFQGMRQDSTTGNNMSLRRWGNPGTGTWTSEDPIGLASGDDDIYGIESNNPNNLLDPAGCASIASPAGGEAAAFDASVASGATNWGAAAQIGTAPLRLAPAGAAELEAAAAMATELEAAGALAAGVLPAMAAPAATITTTQILVAAGTATAIGVGVGLLPASWFGPGPGPGPGKIDPEPNKPGTATIYWYPPPPPAPGEETYGHLSIQVTNSSGSSVHTHMVPYPDLGNITQICNVDQAYAATSPFQINMPIPNAPAAQSYQNGAVGTTGPIWSQTNNCYVHVADVFAHGGAPFPSRTNFFGTLNTQFGFNITNGQPWRRVAP